MRVAALLPLALVPLASASLATDAYKWANDLVSSEAVQASKQGEVHTFDSWSYVDCGESSSWRTTQLRGSKLMMIGLPTDVVYAMSSCNGGESS
jgi:hypothetical protein